MTKDELISKLKKLTEQEESATPVYTQHLDNTFFLYGLTPEVQEEIRGILLALVQDSESHAGMLRTAIQLAQGPNHHVQ